MKIYDFPFASMIRISLACAAIALGGACLDPKDRRPGLSLTGESVSVSVEDWSFTNEHAEIYIEVSTPYWIPHSVTIVCASADGKLFVAARNPTEKRWVAYVGRDPNVRLKIGDKVYEGRLEQVEDVQQQERIYRAYAMKYGWPAQAPDKRPPMAYFEVLNVI